MRYHGMWAAGAMLAAILIGCGPGKELPDETPRSPSDGPGSIESREPIPTSSDPLAREIVDRAINAHTQNHPDRLTQCKISKLTADGTILLPNARTQQEESVPTRMTFLARWPDEIRITLTFPGGSSAEQMTLILDRAFTWAGKGKQEQTIPNKKKAEDNLRADGLGMQWITLLFPLTDRHAIVFEPRKGTGVGTPPADVVKFALPDRPVYRLHFSPKTGYLIQTDYMNEDFGGNAFLEWVMAEHKLFNGVMLPTKMMMVRTPARTNARRITQEWKVDQWEFPARLEEGSFAPPK
jgi:hypothetical protein